MLNIVYFDHDEHTIHQKGMKFTAFVTALLSWLQSPFGNTRDHVLLPSQSFALNIAEGNRKQTAL